MQKSFWLWQCSNRYIISPNKSHYLNLLCVWTQCNHSLWIRLSNSPLSFSMVFELSTVQTQDILFFQRYIHIVAMTVHGIPLLWRYATTQGIPLLQRYTTTHGIPLLQRYATMHGISLLQRYTYTSDVPVTAQNGWSLQRYNYRCTVINTFLLLWLKKEKRFCNGSKIKCSSRIQCRHKHICIYLGERPVGIQYWPIASTSTEITCTAIFSLL